MSAGVHEKGELSLFDILRGLRSKPDFHKVGAIAIFIGVVRGEAKEGKVQMLELEAYEDKANEVLMQICNDLKRREGVVDVQIHHFLGQFKVGEDIVYVVVAGSHRNDVFPVLVEAVEQYKKKAPIFKKEYVINEKGEVKSYWVYERELH